MIDDGHTGIWTSNSLIELDNLSTNTRGTITAECADIIMTNPPFGSKGKVQDPNILSEYDFGFAWKKDKATGGFKKENLLAGKKGGGQVPDILFIERCLALLNEKTFWKWSNDIEIVKTLEPNFWKKTVSSKKHPSIRFGDIFTYQKGTEVGSALYQDDGIPFLRVSDLGDSEIQFGNSSKYINETLFDELRGEYQPHKGELLFSKDATNLALGQIITRMKSSGKRGYKYGYKYGVGFPMSFRDLVVRRLPSNVADKLNLYVFLVSDKGKVELLDWKKLGSIQKI